jgi:hypothetical protein
MIKMIDRFTGVDMWVADERVEEYKAAGHKLAADPEKPAEKPKRTRKKTTKE